ncbi:uncharacterized protein LOC6577735 isoform X2 [Drosophila mojavensis]|uniref:uncharacterized protein LOC6577735 isoform X2 n=1 Tax=Drosophila mojavensis TaxID=7230 RepID=UPI001CD0DB89|nr:uncharacterized protein LOC6577735 isoform X2 [Drosophila mojavensis]
MHKKDEMELDVLVFGSSNIDYISYVNELPRSGETVFAVHRECCYGGKGANQCVAAAKLGARCALISKLGNDKLGAQYLEYLKELDINVDHVQIVDGQCTGLTEINVAENARNMNIVLSGANMMLKCTDVLNARKLFRHAKVLLCQLETDERIVLFALHQFKGVSILNVSPAHPDMNLELIRAPTILCCNRLEAAQLTNREQIDTLQDAKAAATDLIEMGANSVIITMGDRGAVYMSRSEPDLCTYVPAPRVHCLTDTSGASDAFLGSLAYHISIYPNLMRESHISAANICAAHAVGHRGTQPSFPGPELFQERLCQYDPLYFIIEDEAAVSEAEAKATETLVECECVCDVPMTMATPEPMPVPEPTRAPIIVPVAIPEPEPEPEHEPIAVAEPKTMPVPAKEPEAEEPKVQPARRSLPLPLGMPRKSKQESCDSGSDLSGRLKKEKALQKEDHSDEEGDKRTKKSKAQGRRGSKIAPVPIAAPVPIGFPRKSKQETCDSVSELSGHVSRKRKYHISDDEGDRHVTTRTSNKPMVLGTKETKSRKPPVVAPIPLPICVPKAKTEKKPAEPCESGSDISGKKKTRKIYHSTDDEDEIGAKAPRTKTSKRECCKWFSPVAAPVPLATCDSGSDLSREKKARKAYISSDDEREGQMTSPTVNKPLVIGNKETKSVPVAAPLPLPVCTPQPKAAKKPVEPCDSGSDVSRTKKMRKLYHSTDDEDYDVATSSRAKKSRGECCKWFAPVAAPVPLPTCDSGSDLSREKKARKAYFSSDDEGEGQVTSPTANKPMVLGNKEGKFVPVAAPLPLPICAPEPKAAKKPREPCDSGSEVSGPISRKRRGYHSTDDEGERQMTSPMANKPMVLGSKEEKGPQERKVTPVVAPIPLPICVPTCKTRRKSVQARASEKKLPKLPPPIAAEVVKTPKEPSAKKPKGECCKWPKFAPLLAPVPVATCDSGSDLSREKKTRKIHYSTDDEGAGQVTSPTANKPMVLGNKEAKSGPVAAPLPLPVCAPQPKAAKKPVEPCDSGSDVSRTKKMRKLYHSTDDEDYDVATSSRAKKSRGECCKWFAPVAAPVPLPTCDSGSDLSREKKTRKAYISSDDEGERHLTSPSANKPMVLGNIDAKAPPVLIPLPVCDATCKTPKRSVEPCDSGSDVSREKKTRKVYHSTDDEDVEGIRIKKPKFSCCKWFAPVAAPVPLPTCDSGSDLSREKKTRKAYISSDDEGERHLTSPTANKPMVLGDRDAKPPPLCIPLPICVPTCKTRKRSVQAPESEMRAPKLPPPSPFPAEVVKGTMEPRVKKPKGQCCKWFAPVAAPVPLPTCDSGSDLSREKKTRKAYISSDDEGERHLASPTANKPLVLGNIDAKAPPVIPLPICVPTCRIPKKSVEPCDSGSDVSREKKTRKVYHSTDDEDVEGIRIKKPKFSCCKWFAPVAAPVPLPTCDSGSDLSREKKTRKAYISSDDEGERHLTSPSANKPMVLGNIDAKAPPVLIPLPVCDATCKTPKRSVEPCDSGSDVSREKKTRKVYHSTDDEDVEGIRIKKPKFSCCKWFAPVAAPVPLPTCDSGSDLSREKKTRKAYISSDDEGERHLTSPTANKPMVLGDRDAKPPPLCIPLPICVPTCKTRKRSVQAPESEMRAPKLPPPSPFPAEVVKGTMEPRVKKPKGQCCKWFAPVAAPVPLPTCDSGSDLSREKKTRKAYISSDDEGGRHLTSPSANKPMVLGNIDAKAPPVLIPLPVCDATCKIPKRSVEPCDSGSDVSRTKKIRKLYHSTDDEDYEAATSTRPKKCKLNCCKWFAPVAAPVPLPTCDSGSDISREKKTRKVYLSSDDEGERHLASPTANKPMVLGNIDAKAPPVLIPLPVCDAACKIPKRSVEPCDSGSDLPEPVSRKINYSTDDEDYDGPMVTNKFKGCCAMKTRPPIICDSGSDVSGPVPRKIPCSSENEEDEIIVAPVARKSKISCASCHSCNRIRGRGEGRPCKRKG